MPNKRDADCNRSRSHSGGCGIYHIGWDIAAWGIWDGWMIIVSSKRSDVWICGCDGRSCIHNVRIIFLLGQPLWTRSFRTLGPLQQRTWWENTMRWPITWPLSGCCCCWRFKCVSSDNKMLAAASGLCHQRTNVNAYTRKNTLYKLIN